MITLDRLRKRVRRNDRLYHEAGTPEVTDRAYDAIKDDLDEREARSPGPVPPDSPTQCVGGSPAKDRVKVTHALPMLSMDKTYEAEELYAFDRRVRDSLGDAPVYVVEPKIDGVAVTLRYETGRLVQGATRGNGSVGNDITALVRTVPSIPESLIAVPGSGNVPEHIEIRGELYWPTAAFERFNHNRRAAGDKPFANARAGVVGCVNHRDPGAIAGRGLAFIAHGVGQVNGVQIDSHSALMPWLSMLGIPVSPLATVHPNIESVARFCIEWAGIASRLPGGRAALGYDTDGIVIKLDSLAGRDQLGCTKTAARWCIAFKFSGEQVQTRITEIEHSVSARGVRTPVAVVEPVECGGVTIRRVNLHNDRKVQELGLRVGDRVLIERAGSVIPHIVAKVPS